MLSAELLTLLHTIHDAHTLETYTFFPDVYKAGKQKLEKDEVDYLLTEGLISVAKRDSFGAFLTLTDKATHLLKYQ